MEPTKASLRATMRAVRAAVPEAYRREAAMRIGAGVLLQLDQGMPRGVLAYAAMPEEIDPSVAVRMLRGSGVRVAYPRVSGPGQLRAHWAEFEDLRPGYFGLGEPPSDSEEADLSEIDLVLVPGVAFDEGCHRLGMGGGFYDRLLAALAPSATTIGLGFDEQIVGAVPHEEHDVVLDAVLTPRRIFRRGETPTYRS